MTDLKKKLSYLKKSRTLQKRWDRITGDDALSTRRKLEKLVAGSLRNKKPPAPRRKESLPAADGEDWFTREYLYPLDLDFNGIRLGDYLDFTAGEIDLLAGESLPPALDPRRVVFFDTETTGLAGGTGTLPFMLGFGYFEGEFFKVRSYILANPARETTFLEEVDRFLQGQDFSGTVTYNGRGFDFPLMDTRYLLQRRRFSLLDKPHLDLLFPARMIWKHTYESRKLGFLGDILLGISRDDDVPGFQIPGLYFDFLRDGNPETIQRICEHNSMDLVGLCGLMIMALQFLRDPGTVTDQGTALGAARLLERKGRTDRAEAYYRQAVDRGDQPQLTRQALLRLSLLMKRQCRFAEAGELWARLLDFPDPGFAYRELAMLHEHREKTLDRALELVEKALESGECTEFYREDFCRRRERLRRRIARRKQQGR